MIRLLCILLLSVSTQAQSDLKVMRNRSKIYIKITLHNPRPKWEGRFSLQCWFRSGLGGPWLLLRQWKTLPALGPGQRLSREIFDWNNPLLTLLASIGPIQVRSIISAPGLMLKQERILPAPY